MSKSYISERWSSLEFNDRKGRSSSMTRRCDLTRSHTFNTIDSHPLRYKTTSTSSALLMLSPISDLSSVFANMKLDKGATLLRADRLDLGPSPARFASYIIHIFHVHSTEQLLLWCSVRCTKPPNSVHRTVANCFHSGYHVSLTFLKCALKVSGSNPDSSIQVVRNCE